MSFGVALLAFACVLGAQAPTPDASSVESEAEGAPPASSPDEGIPDDDAPVEGSPVEASPLDVAPVESEEMTDTPPASPIQAMPPSSTTSQTSPASARAQVHRLLILAPTASENDAALAESVAGLIAVELATIESFDLITDADVRRLIALEGDRQAVGCTDVSCLAEVAGALGARLVVFGEVTRLGSLLIINLSLFDAVDARSVGRTTIQLDDVEALPFESARAARALVAPFLRAQGSVVDLNPVTSEKRVKAEQLAMLPWTLVGAGALAGVAAVLVGGLASLPAIFTAIAVQDAQRATEAGNKDDFDDAAASHGTWAPYAWPGLGVTAASAVVVVVALASVGAGAASLAMGENE